MKTAILLIVALLVSACTAGNAIDPKSIGSGRDDLKKSPCACGPEIAPFRHG